MLDPEMHLTESHGEETAFLSAPEQDAFMLGESPEEFALEGDNLQPIMAVFGPGVAAHFVWAVTTDTIETYEHRETLRFLHIDRITGECFNQNCEVISSESALQHAFQPRSKATADLVHEIVAVEPEELTSLAAPPDAEPKLNEFVRKMEWTETSLEEATPVSSSFQLTVFSGLNKILGQTKLEWLGKRPWGHSSSPAEAQENGSLARNSQEPNFATFTRRTSAS